MTSFIRSLVLLAFLARTVAAQAQGGCPNIGFENGNLSNWQAGTGWCCPIACNNSAPINGRHTLMSGPGTDPFTGGAVPVVAPGGGAYSVRLGNSSVDAQAERLSYTMTVDASNSLFVYRYAVVLEDPSHSDFDQPRFEIRTIDENGNPIGCGQYSVTASAGIDGFQTYDYLFYDPIRFKNWTTVGIDLSANIGQTVTIEFSTGDCSQGGHFGYAYLDAYCSALVIDVQYCPGLTEAVLEAPPGFESYLWSTGETTASITIQNPTVGASYSCTLTAVTGCQVTLNAVLTPNIVASSYELQGNCMNDVAFFDDSQTLSGPPITSWNWNFGDGGTSTLQNPTHSFSTPGDHLITLIVTTDVGCTDTVEQVIDLLPSPLIGFDHTTACDGVPIAFTNTTTSPSSVLTTRWDLGDGTLLTNIDDIEHTFSAGGTYNVELFVATLNGCQDSLTLPVTVLPNPQFDLGADINVCANVPVTINATVPTATYLWNTSATSATISPAASGTYSVVATFPSGCSTADSTTVTFFPLPTWDLPDSIACILDPVTLDAGNPGATYLWNTGATTRTIVPASSGTYSATITTINNCVTTGSMQLTYAPSINVDLGSDTLLCDGIELILNAGVFPQATYLWSTAETTPQIVATTTSSPHVTVTNGYCTGSDTIDLVFSTLPVLNLPADTVCIESSYTLDAGNPGCTYLWSTGATTRIITIDSITGPYSVVVTNPDGCVSTDVAFIAFYPSILVDLGPDTVLCQGESLELDAGAFFEASYQWNNGTNERWTFYTGIEELWVDVTNGFCNGGDTIRVGMVQYPTPASITYYEACFEDPRDSLLLVASPDADLVIWAEADTLRHIVVDRYGSYLVRSLNLPRCAVDQVIEVVEHCPARVFLANSFTPNGDGINDVYMPMGYNFATQAFTIIDRWGRIVFNTTEHAVGWDGTLDGAPVQDGVYEVVLRYRPFLSAKGLMGNEELSVGHVTVLR